jgi:hypothetical protein
MCGMTTSSINENWLSITVSCQSHTSPRQARGLSSLRNPADDRANRIPDAVGVVVIHPRPPTGSQERREWAGSVSLRGAGAGAACAPLMSVRASMTQRKAQTRSCDPNATRLTPRHRRDDRHRPRLRPVTATAARRRTRCRGSVHDCLRRRNTVCLGQLPNDREPDSQAATVGGVRVIALPEQVEDVRQLLLGQAIAVVSDRDRHRPVVHRHRQPDMPLRPRVLRRVVQEVADDLEQAVRVAVDDQRSGRQCGIEILLPGVHRRPAILGGEPEDGSQVDRAAFEPELARRRTRHVEQVLDQGSTCEPPRSRSWISIGREAPRRHGLASAGSPRPGSGPAGPGAYGPRLRGAGRRPPVRTRPRPMAAGGWRSGPGRPGRSRPRTRPAGLPARAAG